MWKLTQDINIGDDIYDVTDEIKSNVMLATGLRWEEYIQIQDIETPGLKIKMEQNFYTDEWHIKIYVYDPNHEEDDIEKVLAAIAPLTKSVSLLPHSAIGVYPQMPEEGLSQEEYDRRLQAIKPVDWSKLTRSDGVDDKYCQGDVCERVSNG